MAQKRRVAIIGAGPIGLETALRAAEAGHEVRLFEQGRVAEHIRRWEHVRMFSPFGMNSSPHGRAALQSAGQQLPDADALLTGREFVECYLEPLRRLPQITAVLHEGCRVSGVARDGLLKHELIGNPLRRERPFVLRVTGAEESLVESDVVLDCSGTFGQPNFCGPGGLPPLGRAEVDSGLPDILGPARARYAGRHTVVVGCGYTAATNVTFLAQLAEVEPGTRITWLTRRAAAAPLLRIPDDALPERDRLAARANALAAGASPHVVWRPASIVRKVAAARAQDGTEVEVEDLVSRRRALIVCDRVLANCGHRPDRTLYSELHIHECYATQGPIKLAARLLGETSTDCLAQTSHGVETLKNPEPDYYVLGAKSYGRNSRFLLHVGLQQVEEVVRELSGES